MKANYEHVSFLLDRSGSMNSIKSDVIGGFNQFIEDQKKHPGEVSISLLSFASSKDTSLIYHAVKLQDIKPLTNEDYRPMGSTALNDSFAHLIDITGKKLDALSEDERPDKVLIVCISDGQENDSVEHTNATLKDIIEYQKSKYGWEFVFIGANQDSITEAKSRGIGKSMDFQSDSLGTQNMYSNLSASNVRYRSTGNFQTSTTK